VKKNCAAKTRRYSETPVLLVFLARQAFAFARSILIATPSPIAIGCTKNDAAIASTALQKKFSATCLKKRIAHPNPTEIAQIDQK
jgi:hypothetical protein